MIRTYIHDAITHQVIASAGTDLTRRWSWICETVAASFDCQPDDVDCVETDDGEFITARGERVAYLDRN